MAAAAVAPPITVTPPADAEVERTPGAHWKDAAGSGFRNPWPSYKGDYSLWDIWKLSGLLRAAIKNDPDPANIDSLAPSVKPDFGISLPWNQLKATWLGHACFLVEMPSRTEGGRGLTILFDPAFSNRCSPFQSFGGIVRYTPPPASVAELPEIDAVVISHNHYDHCDTNTLGELYKKQANRPPPLFVGLSGAANLRSTVGKGTDIVELDWWEDRIVEVQGKGKIRLTATPCQHGCSRYGYDRDRALWIACAVQSLDENDQVGASAWHAGDTGYCSVYEETHTFDPSLPVCPAFAEIGERLGPFSVGMIPIGAFAPRALFSPVHNAPIDAVRMFRDTKCKQAIGMHWGTWRMALDRIAEGPERLVQARKDFDVSEEEFGVVALGETRGYGA